MYKQNFGAAFYHCLNKLLKTELWLNRKNGKSTEKEQKQEQFYTVGQSLENCWSPGVKTESGNCTRPNSQLIFLAGEFLFRCKYVHACVCIIALFVCLTNVFWSKNVYRAGGASVYTYIYWLLPAAYVCTVGGGGGKFFRRKYIGRDLRYLAPPPLQLA